MANTLLCYGASQPDWADLTTTYWNTQLSTDTNNQVTFHNLNKLYRNCISRIPMQELALSQVILLLIILCRCVCHHCSNNCLFERKWPKLSLHVINQVIDWSQRSMLLYMYLVCTSVLLLKIINYSSSYCPLGCILRCFYYFLLISIVFSWQWGQAGSS